MIFLNSQTRRCVNTRLQWILFHLFWTQIYELMNIEEVARHCQNNGAVCYKGVFITCPAPLPSLWWNIAYFRRWKYATIYVRVLNVSFQRFVLMYWWKQYGSNSFLNNYFLLSHKVKWLYKNLFEVFVGNINLGFPWTQKVVFRKCLDVCSV